MTNEQYYYVSDVPYKIKQTHSSKRYMYALYHKKDSRDYSLSLRKAKDPLWPLYGRRFLND